MDSTDNTQTGRPSWGDTKCKKCDRYNARRRVYLRIDKKFKAVGYICLMCGEFTKDENIEFKRVYGQIEIEIS